MRIAVCDDEKSELGKIGDYLEEYLYSRNIQAKTAYYENSAEMVSAEMVQGGSDIYILDIIMPEINGIELGKELKKLHEGETFIIYITSSREFALESYSVKAFSYLLKPVMKETLFKELDECRLYIKKTMRRCEMNCTEGMYITDEDDILYIEYNNHRMIYTLTEGRKLEGVYKRGSFDMQSSQFLEHNCFLKVSASFIINMRQVARICQNSFVMLDGKEISITRKYSGAKKVYIDFQLNGGT